jgi:hypothetical protein
MRKIKHIDRYCAVPPKYISTLLRKNGFCPFTYGAMLDDFMDQSIYIQIITAPDRIWTNDHTQKKKLVYGYEVKVITKNMMLFLVDSYNEEKYSYYTYKTWKSAMNDAIKNAIKLWKQVNK